MFRVAYKMWFGEKGLGLPISPVIKSGNVEYQFFEAGEMVYDPALNQKEHIYLAPLGRDLVDEEPPVPKPSDPGVYWVDGHIIAPEVVPLYEQIKAYFIGKPLTEWRYDPIQMRWEQYFERLGFYREEGRSEVHLLEYGKLACKCPEHQAQAAPMNAKGSFQPRVDVDQTFIPYVKQLGIIFTGSAITPAYWNRDGQWEQIFERVVLVADEPMSLGTVRLRPLALDVRIPSDSPRAASGSPDMQFYKSSGELGYDIPTFFWEYLAAHGGLQISGPPITQVGPLNGQVMQQCFTNVCLMFDLRAATGRQVLPTPYGQVFKLMYYSSRGQAPAAMSDKPTVWERQPVIAAGEAQEISVRLMSQGRAVAGAAPILTVHLPDGTAVNMTFPATNSNGVSTLRLQPIDAPNGALILYEVCPTSSVNKSNCTGDSFIIWSTP